MALPYPHLLSPLRLGNNVLKHRMIASPGYPYFVQGDQPYPTEELITSYAMKAKNGAALVVFASGAYSAKRPPSRRTMDGHFLNIDLFDTHSWHYLSSLTEAVHFYGAKITLEVVPQAAVGFDISRGVPSVAPGGDGAIASTGEEMPVEMFAAVADEQARKALAAQECGFDGVFLHMAYRLSTAGRALSPRTNMRTDEFGGSLENRCRFPLMVCDRIKEACGEDFIIEASLTGVDSAPGGWTLEDSIGFAKLAEGHLDMIQVRAAEIDPAHPTGFNPEATPFLEVAAAIKRSGVRVPIVAVGGFLDLEAMEEAIATEKADIIALSRAWISNPEYGRLAYEGRNEDVVPCIRCNKCHRSSFADPWASYCSVNPAWGGFEHRVDWMIDPPMARKKVAVVGGGPAGLKAALVAADRGHEVTLLEQREFLGGQLARIENVSFKWPVRDFKNYLIRQVEKAPIQLDLNVEATSELLKGNGYEVVLVAVGSEPIVPPIPGADGKHVVHAVDVFGREDSLAENVVIVGGGEAGVETGMYLAEKGHNVTVVEMLGMLASDATPLHYYSMFKEAWEALPTFSYILNARCTRIYDGGIRYVGSDGSERELEAGTVVLSVGMKPRIGAALRLFDPAYDCRLIGDCAMRAGNIQKAIRSAFSIASVV